MRVVITGATGNLGTSCIAALVQEPRVREIVGLARRLPDVGFPKTRFVRADVRSAHLPSLFAGADAIIHLAWALQPSHAREELEQVNVQGSRRVFRAAIEAGVPTLIHASSIGTYAEGHGRVVDESWSHGGISSATYSAQKAAVEQELDTLEALHPSLRVVRMRPAFVFKREAASGIQRLFIGSLIPRVMFQPGALPLIPQGLTIQCVHSLDVGRAFAAAVLRDVRGAFNLAAEPVLDSEALSRLIDSPTTRLSPRLLKGLSSVAWHLHLQPSEPGWIDLAFGSPMLDCTRARSVLGWQPLHDARDTFLALLEGLWTGEGLPTPPLKPRRRWSEWAATP
jgi:nucleoside-diphosphate-sugar epimerase